MLALLPGEWPCRPCGNWGRAGSWLAGLEVLRVVPELGNRMDAMLAGAVPAEGAPDVGPAAAAASQRSEAAWEVGNAGAGAASLLQGTLMAAQLAWAVAPQLLQAGAQMLLAGLLPQMQASVRALAGDLLGTKEGAAGPESWHAATCRGGPPQRQPPSHLRPAASGRWRPIEERPLWSQDSSPSPGLPVKQQTTRCQ